MCRSTKNNHYEKEVRWNEVTWETVLICFVVHPNLHMLHGRQPGIRSFADWLAEAGRAQILLLARRGDADGAAAHQWKDLLFRQGREIKDRLAAHQR